jgi:FMN phosphatase YigB (HAD superfamily)
MVQQILALREEIATRTHCGLATPGPFGQGVAAMDAVEVVVFDLGKVLVDFDYSLVASRLRAKTDVALEEVAVRLDRSPLLVEYETGRIDTPEFFRRVQELTGYRGTLNDFASDFGDIFFAIDEMIAWHARLRERGIPTFIFSNTNELAVRHIRSAFPFFSGFDAYIYSHEVGAMKPDAKIYEAVERVTGRKGGQILYIDDKPENVAAGQARGWRTILQENPAATLEQARTLGLEG